MRTIVILLLAAPLFAQGESTAELKKRIAELEAEVRALSAQLEGTAAPINLARTSLAAVTASSVNGSRPLDNKFYGVLNLFDDGANKIEGTSYPYWMTGGEPRPWVEIRFDVPVTIAGLGVEGGAAFSVQLKLDKGGEVSATPFKGETMLAKPQAGVRTVRVTFDSNTRTPLQVHELRVFGYAPKGVEYKVGLPRIRLTREHATAVARERFAAWKEEMLGSTREEISKRADGSYEVTFFRDAKPLLAVVVGKGNQVTLEPRVHLE